ncbi:MAG TPA: polysaccharide deacetylase family protein [Actinomycetota bacterium]
MSGASSPYLWLRHKTRRGLRYVTRPVHPLIGSIRRVDTQRAVAALTFDDGPDEEQTDRILEVLERKGAKATFFMLAKQAVRLPEVVRAVQDGGHEIGLHGYDHSPVIGITSMEKVRKMRDGKRRLEDAIGRSVQLFRPPYGWQDLRSFLAARSAGLRVILWSTEADDCVEGVTPEVAAEKAVRLETGGILLLHDRAEPYPTRPDERPAAGLDRARMVELISDRLEGRLSLVSVGTLLRQGAPERKPWFWQPVGAEAVELLGR